MTLTLLLDLDDTLLNTNIESFIPAYFQALAKALSPFVSPDLMLRSLMAGTKRMLENQDFSQTLEQVFSEVYYSQMNSTREALWEALEHFYTHDFPQLRELTSQRSDAKPFVDWAISRGYRIAIATDPLFPSAATEHRLRWAGFDPAQFELVSSFERFHFTKTSPAYYAEVLGHLGWPEGPVLMVGNDAERDILSAKKLGLATYHVDAETASSFGPDANAGGKLADLPAQLESSDLSALTPLFKTRESILAVLSATPAALNSLSRELDSKSISREPSADDWALAEIFCHLRDTESEIHHMQIRLFSSQSEPFIPRPDTSIWARQRDYLHEDGVSALLKFNENRRETISMLEKIPDEEWSNKARHAIFGPTNFLEVIGFIAEHDRLHVQQAYNTMKKL